MCTPVNWDTLFYVRCGVTISVTRLVKNIFFWNITPYSLEEVHWRSRETYNFHLHGGWMCRKKEGTNIVLASCLLGLVFDPEDDPVLSCEMSINFDLTTRRHIKKYSFLYIISICKLIKQYWIKYLIFEEFISPNIEESQI
jgi:hypothetical protein